MAKSKHQRYSKQWQQKNMYAPYYLNYPTDKVLHKHHPTNHDQVSLSRLVIKSWTRISTKKRTTYILATPSPHPSTPTLTLTLTPTLTPTPTHSNYNSDWLPSLYSRWNARFKMKKISVEQFQSIFPQRRPSIYSKAEHFEQTMMEMKPQTKW